MYDKERRLAAKLRLYDDIGLTTLATRQVSK